MAHAVGATGSGGTSRKPGTRKFDSYGITVDGERNPLGGQPPVAVSKGWGQRPRRRSYLDAYLNE